MEFEAGLSERAANIVTSMKLLRPTLTIDGDRRAVAAAELRLNGSSKTIWFSVDAAYCDSITLENLDAFLLAALVPAMQKGDDLVLCGPVSEKLYYGLVHSYISLLSILIPSLKPVRILPESLISNRFSSSTHGVVTGFSGGIDSFCLLADHFFGDVPPGYRITHLVMNNVGSHGSGGSRLFKERLLRLRSFAQEVNLPLISIDSNLDDIFPFPFQQTDTMRNASAILLLQKMFSRYISASSFRYQDCRFAEADDTAYMDPAAFHLLSTETTECVSSGSEYSRVEKTARVAELEPARRYLDVCVDPNFHGNCSVCFKCARTIFTLELLGKASAFSAVFDLDRFKRIRDDYLADLILSNDPFAREIREFMSGHSLKFPGRAYLRAGAKRLPKPLRRFIRTFLPKRRP
jgi:hypothetical protein